MALFLMFLLSVFSCCCSSFIFHPMNILYIHLFFSIYFFWCVYCMFFLVAVQLLLLILCPFFVYLLLPSLWQYHLMAQIFPVFIVCSLLPCRCVTYPIAIFLICLFNVFLCCRSAFIVQPLSYFYLSELIVLSMSYLFFIVTVQL